MKYKLIIFKVILLLILTIFITGCIEQKLSKPEFEFLWNEYVKTEFNESFYEEQSQLQRRNLMNNILKKYKISKSAFYQYLKQYDKKKYELFYSK